MKRSSSTPHSVDLPIDTDGAYAFLTDLEFLPEWYPGLTGITDAPEEPTTGSQFVEHRRVAPGVSVPIQLTVTQAQPGRSFDVRAARRGVGSIEGRYQLTPIASDRTRVTVSHEVATPTLLAPARTALELVLARGDANQVDAMPHGLERWRASS